MTTRHTITHADELYAGAAFKDGYSPDGRRGIKMTHLYAHEFLSTAAVPAIAGLPAGILSSGVASDLGINATGLANFLSLCSGVLATATGQTTVSFDVPRNIVFVCCNAFTGVYLKVEGLDQYGESMAEAIKGKAAGVAASGRRCFKSINKLFVTAAFSSTVSIGTGNRLGLPFHLADKGKLVCVSIDGKTNTSGATAAYTIHIGASAATTITSSGGQPDVRGDILFSTPAPNGSRRITALMIVDHSTVRKAFGPPQVSSCSNGV